MPILGRVARSKKGLPSAGAMQLGSEPAVSLFNFYWRCSSSHRPMKRTQKEKGFFGSSCPSYTTKMVLPKDASFFAKPFS